MTPRATHHIDQLDAAATARDADGVRAALANVEKTYGTAARVAAERVYCKPAK